MSMLRKDLAIKYGVDFGVEIGDTWPEVINKLLERQSERGKRLNVIETDTKAGHKWLVWEVL